MKVAKIISRILAIGCGIAALVMFFCPIFKIVGTEGTFEISGFQLALGMNTTSWSGNTVNLDVSAYYTFALLTVAFSAIMACFSFKKEGYMGSAFWSSLISAVLVLLFRFNTPASYVDYRPITGSTAATREYLIFFDLLFALVLASVVLFAVAILIADYVAVLESNGEKKTIFARIITFFREYKSEIKKITWPGMSTVTKNTIVVLVMCVIVGILIFLLDTGLVWILDSILKLKS